MNSIHKIVAKFLDYYCALGCSRMPNEMHHSDVILFVIEKVLNRKELHKYFLDSVYENLESQYHIIKDDIDKFKYNINDIIKYIEFINRDMSSQYKNNRWDEFIQKDFLILEGVLEILCQSDRIYNSKGLNNESNT